MTTKGPSEVAYLDGKADLTSATRHDFYHFLAYSIALDLDNGIQITAETYAENCRSARAAALEYEARSVVKRAAS